MLLGTRIKLHIALHSLICKYLLFLAANKKNPVFCWNPQDFHFCINYRFSDGLRPSWPQSLCSVEFLLNRTIVKIWEIVPANFWTGDLSRVRRTWWPLHYRNLQPGLRLSFQSWILVNFTTYGAWPPVTYLTYLTGPTQAFRGQCINNSLFKFIIILLCKTYSTTLKKHPVTS